MSKVKKSRVKLLHQYYKYTGFYSFIWQGVKGAILPTAFIVAILFYVNYKVINLNEGLVYITQNFSDLFIFGVFTQLIAPGTSWLKLALYSIVMASVSLGWYSCLIALMTHSYFKHHFNSWQNILMKIMGIVLLGISLTIFVNAITRIL